MAKSVPAKTSKVSTLPRSPALALAKALEHQALSEPHKLFREHKQKAAQKLREMASQK